MTYVIIIIIVVAALCVPLLLGLVVAARQRPSRHDRTLEHIEKLEKELGMGSQADAATRPPRQIEPERAHIPHPGEQEQTAPDTRA